MQGLQGHRTWIEPKLNIMLLIHGDHLELPDKKTFSGSLSGWVIGTSIIGIGMVI